MSDHDPTLAPVTRAKPGPTTGDSRTPSPIGRWSSNIQARHLDLRAIVYVRQSDPQTVLRHKESGARQYALVDHAVALGWPRERILIVDDDQGHSGTSA